MREEPAIQHSRETEAVEKRKIEAVEANGTSTGEIANGVSSAKRVKLSASSAPGAWTSHPLSAQEATYPAPTLSSSNPEVTVSISTSTGDASTVVQNEVPSHHPCAHTLKDTTFKAPEARTSHRRYLHGRGRIHFPIYEDPQTKQDFFEEVYQWDTIGYPTPGEDKENSDESFANANSDVEMGGATDDEEEDRDIEMGDAGELEIGADDSGSLSDVSAGTADPTVYAGSLLEPPWTTNRGQPLGLVREGRAFNVS